jgi:hypothetical protein
MSEQKKEGGGILGGLTDTVGGLAQGLTSTVGNTVGNVGKGVGELPPLSPQLSVPLKTIQAMASDPQERASATPCQASQRA